MNIILVTTAARQVTAYAGSKQLIAGLRTFGDVGLNEIDPANNVLKRK